MKTVNILIGIILLGFSIMAQENNPPMVQETNPPVKPAPFSSENWANDQTTIDFGDKAKKRSYLSGVRIYNEPNFGLIIQRGLNKFKTDFLTDLPKVGVETNLYQGYVALQLGLIYPSGIKFVPESEVVVQNYLKSTENEVDVDYGTTIGLSFLDGILAIGVGTLYLDRFDYKSEYDGKTNERFWFVNIQLVNALKFGLKSTKKDE